MKKKILIVIISVITVILLIIVTSLFARIFSDKVDYSSLNNNTVSQSYEVTEEIGEEVIINGTETGVVIDEIVSIENDDVDNPYVYDVQGVSYEWSRLNELEYENRMKDIADCTWDSAMNENIKITYLYGLKRYCEDNGINETFSVDLEACSKPTQSRTTYRVYNEIRELYITVDYDRSLIGVTENFTEEK